MNYFNSKRIKRTASSLLLAYGLLLAVVSFHYHPLVQSEPAFDQFTNHAASKTLNNDCPVCHLSNTPIIKNEDVTLNFHNPCIQFLKISTKVHLISTLKFNLSPRAPPSVLFS